MYCRFCSSEWRIWAILLITYSNSQRKTHQIAQIRHSEETTIHSNWGTFTFILSFNLNISRYKFTILRLFNILPYISLFSNINRHTACVGTLWSNHCKLESTNLKRYYDENSIFPIEAILKHKEGLYKKKNALYFFQISLFIPEIFKFLKYAN